MPWDFPNLRVLHILHGDPLKAETKLLFQDSILKLLNEGSASRLKYIIFDDDPVYGIFKEPVRRVQIRSLVGSTTKTILLGEKMFDWMGRHKFEVDNSKANGR